MDQLTQLAIESHSAPSKMNELMIAAFEEMQSWTLPEPADPAISAEDLIAEVLMELPKAVKKYCERDGSTKWEFGKYLRVAVCWAISDATRKFNRRKCLMEDRIREALEHSNIELLADSDDNLTKPFNANTYSVNL